MENISLGVDIFSMIFITFVLLKTLVFIRPISFKRVGYHWTLLELKLAEIVYFFCGIRVIIEPYWNWNNSIHSIWKTFQSVIIEPYWNWNDGKTIVVKDGVITLSLNLIGIETY